MLRHLSLGLLASAISVASLPAIAQEDGGAALLRQQRDKLLEQIEQLKQRKEQLEAQISGSAQGKDDAFDLQEISLNDAVKFNWGFQGALQGAGTPNQAGIGGFLPLSVGENSVWFLDALANANFSDYENNSSIINTDVAGTTISTSSRLGYRWLNGDRSWMYGLNAGYDSRPMNTGGTDTGINVSGTEKSAFFQQVVVNAEAVSNDWNLNAYALIPIGDTEQDLNSFYQGGALNTYGLDVGYFITPELNASVGYYYQNGDLGSADGSGVLGRVAYEISNGLTAGVNISYDEAFETRVSADLKVRFGGASTTAQRKEVQQQPVINALTSSPRNRDVRVHDIIFGGDDFECETKGIFVFGTTRQPDGKREFNIVCSVQGNVKQVLEGKGSVDDQGAIQANGFD
ncbi:ABC transporter C-terminal domain-containing protein [Synechococcus sp. CC9311]|uniref:ABC transporter C-terminal domain-containing protein n=1 Tax=Synechococcus sp. (strain CC9311) TaxID=64471 RepID=UPI0000DDADCD|nr:ABC transporter C-terminal domain-containing protein [Synechococcus sp. CC9311]ABI47647.1 possible Carbamoyl-phosphate synthase L chain [Synechococcus sp. CC9311]